MQINTRPSSTQAEGVVWLPEEAFVRAGTDGFVRRIAATAGTIVQPGQTLVEFENIKLDAEVAEKLAKVDELSARFDSEWTTDKVKAEITRKDLESAQADLARIQERTTQLVIRSVTRGTFTVPNLIDLPGRYVKKGEPIGYVVAPGNSIVRTVVTQADIDLVRQRTRSVEVRITQDLAKVLPARISREVPLANDQLPTAALGSLGGGKIATDPGDSHGLKTLESVFQLDLTLPTNVQIPVYGGRAYVRFDHEREPLSRQWYRRVRQLLLRRLDV